MPVLISKILCLLILSHYLSIKRTQAFLLQLPGELNAVPILYFVLTNSQCRQYAARVMDMVEILTIRYWLLSKMANIKWVSNTFELMLLFLQLPILLASYLFSWKFFLGLTEKSPSHLFSVFQRKDQSFNPNHKVVREDW